MAWHSSLYVALLLRINISLYCIFDQLEVTRILHVLAVRNTLTRLAAQILYAQATDRAPASSHSSQLTDHGTRPQTTLSSNNMVLRREDDGRPAISHGPHTITEISQGPRARISRSRTPLSLRFAASYSCGLQRILQSLHHWLLRPPCT